MSEEIYVDKEEENKVCHINSRTRPMFREMLNKVGEEIKIGKSSLKYGDALFKLDEEEFQSLFNRWVSLCKEKNIMRLTLSRDSEKKLEWDQNLSDVERAFSGMEALKEILE